MPEKDLSILVLLIVVVGDDLLEDCGESYRRGDDCRDECLEDGRESERTGDVRREVCKEW